MLTSDWQKKEKEGATGFPLSCYTVDPFSVGKHYDFFVGVLSLILQDLSLFTISTDANLQQFPL